MAIEAPVIDAEEPQTFKERVWQAAVVGALMMGSLGCYLLIERWRGHAPVLITRSRWDSYIPFHHEWVWVYLLPYVLGPLVIGSLSRGTFRWFVKRGLAVIFITLAIFITLPTQVVRPAVDLDDSFTAGMYRDMAAIDDPPANAAPSLHVSLTCLLAFALSRDYPRWTPVAFGGASLIWLSTLFTHQHHLFDVLSGILMASLAAWPWRRSA